MHIDSVVSAIWKIPDMGKQVARAFPGLLCGPACILLPAAVLVLLCTAAGETRAAQLKNVSILDRDYLAVHFLDGEVIYDASEEQNVIRYTPELDTAAAADTANWTLTSPHDGNYGGAGRHPVSCYRKTKLSGHGQMEWSGSDFLYEYTYQHWIFLRLPSPLQQGTAYTLTIDPATHSDDTSETVTFDIYSSCSEAVHVNLAGFDPEALHKAADLYCWLGDGGARDYSNFENNSVYLYNVGSGQTHSVGSVKFWAANAATFFWNNCNLIQSDVWNADFDYTGSGIFRLVIEGVGCSQDFEISGAVYRNPFRICLRGFFYMRVGQDNSAGLTPPPRTPLYIPEASPPSTRVYLTTMHPYHPQWGTFSSGDVWDAPDDWIPYCKTGTPTNPDGWGGHADALDWDRHLGHVSIIYDMLLPYILTRGAISDDSTGIAESGNGIPDVIDEARNEVDFWLRLRDGDGYCHGLTNPNSSDELFQAAPTAVAAWANAANTAMLADAFRIAGLTGLMEQYRNKAAAAYNYAGGLADMQLDAVQDVGDSTMRGRDFRMTAAAFLYNVTGDTVYEDAVSAESMCTSGTAEIETGSYNQIWATAGYLFTSRTVHYPVLWNNMKASVIYQAHQKEAGLASARNSRRATDDVKGYFRTAQNVHRTLVAHAVADDTQEREGFRKALTLEADWGLGRNPLNIIQMTTASTPLQNKRSVLNIYTSGRSDTVPGLHPGHTPYLNLDDWYPGMTMGRPSALYENSFPADFKANWPIAEGCFDTRWVWAHSEFTPQQTMRGKIALYGYLHGISSGSGDGQPDDSEDGDAEDGFGFSCSPAKHPGAPVMMLILLAALAAWRNPAGEINLWNRKGA